MNDDYRDDDLYVIDTTEEEPKPGIFESWSGAAWFFMFFGIWSIALFGAVWLVLR